MNNTISMFSEVSHVLKGSDIQNYIEGGHAVVTLKSPSDKHYTYSFRKPMNPSAIKRSSPDTRFVKVHFENDWVYLGAYHNYNGRSQFNPSTTSLFPEWHEVIKGVQYLMRMCNDPDMDTPMQVYHEGVCCKCGRKLTDPKYIERGVGPRCAKMIGGIK